MRGVGAATAMRSLAALAAAVLLAVGCGGGDREGAAAKSWGALAPTGLARTEVAAARIGDRIYVIGGFISTGGTTDRVERYDISADRWSEVAELPIAVNHAAAVAYRGRLYVLGGNRPRSAGEAKSNRLYRYIPADDRWVRLPDMPTARAALAVGEIDGKLYAAGGYTDADDRLTTLEIYDVAQHRWRSGPAMPTGRNHVAGAVLGGKLYVTGGRPGPEHGGLTTVELYAPQSRRWAELAPMGTARSGHAAVAVGGRLVVFGGEELDGGNTIEQVEAYRPDRDRWSSLPQMVTPRHGLGAAVRGSRIYALEGGPEPGLAYARSLEYLDVGPG